MATAALPQREIIRFEPGKPETIRLKYASGREISGQYGPQVMFSTSDGRIFFVDPPVARMIADAGIGVDEAFRLGKTRKPKGGFDWAVERQGEDRGVYRPIEQPAPRTEVYEPARTLETLEDKLTASIAQAQARNAAPESISPLAVKLCATMCALVDAMSEAKAYAARKRIDLTNEDLRCLVTTAFIQEAKGGAR